jgi:hypothetical protein
MLGVPHLGGDDVTAGSSLVGASSIGIAVGHQFSLSLVEFSTLPSQTLLAGWKSAIYGKASGRSQAATGKVPLRRWLSTKPAGARCDRPHLPPRVGVLRSRSGNQWRHLPAWARNIRRLPAIRRPHAARGSGARRSRNIARFCDGHAVSRPSRSRLRT